jgi:hypothetical protein
VQIAPYPNVNTIAANDNTIAANVNTIAANLNMIAVVVFAGRANQYSKLLNFLLFASSKVRGWRPCMAVK